jgi:class 3 adenylate cyclase
VYIASALVLTFYGVQVCPFIETLSSFELATILLCSFAIVLVVRIIIVKKAEKRNENLLTPTFYLYIDLSCWILMGVLMTLWNTINYSFPVGSGLKVVLGSFTMGIFSATYIALEVEHSMIKYFQENPDTFVFRKEKFFSLAKKFMVFVGVTLVCIASILLLLVYKDFEYVIENLNKGIYFEFRWVVQEVLFVFAVLIAGAFLIIKRYTGNLNLILDLQLKVFKSVENEDFSSHVPIVTNDELGEIAKYTNKMITGLSEKKKIKDTFGKYLNPEIVNKILKSGSGPKLGGESQKVALMFTDIRSFTSITENIEPGKLINHLNNYFSLILEVIRKNNGVLDKFIGDASLSIFGLNDSSIASNSAFNAAKEIQKELNSFNNTAEQIGLPRFNTGVGIHFGYVVVGNIGSRKRLEYTVIGDAVNTASRIENLTKSLDKSILLSKELYSNLDKAAKDSTELLGDYEVKGKSEKVTIYTPRI